MSTDNLSPDAGAVKVPVGNSFASRTGAKGSRQRKPADSAAKVEEDKAEKDAEVQDLAAARMAKDDALEKQWLDKHRTDARSGEVKPPSLDHIFAKNIVSGKTGNWSCQANEGTGAIVHRWADTYWKAINNEVGCMEWAGDWLDRHASHAASAKKAQQCWEYAIGRLRRHKPLPALDTSRAIVPCADVYIEVLPKGFQVLAPDPALGMTHAIRVTTGGKVNRPYFTQVLPQDSLFAKFLARAQPDPAVRALIQEQCGMTLLPGNYSQAAWWYGVAGSGKSTLAELVEAMHRQSVRLNLETLGDRFSLEPLVGASLILVDEVECEKWAEGRFKTLVSGNGIGIDRKNEKVLASYHSRAKWLITSNSAPFIRDKSDGVWRRLVVVYWGVEIPQDERQNDFHQILLEKEGKLILDWMLEGARRVVERGRAMPDRELPEEVRSAKQRARNNCDSVRAWAHDMRVAPAEGELMSTADIYKHYEAWCTTQGYLMNEILTSRQFWNGMASARLVNPDRKVNRRVEGKQTDFYELKIRGRAVEQIRVWVENDDVSGETDEVVATIEIFAAYQRWAKARVARKAMPADCELSESEFWEGLTQSRVVDPAKRVCTTVKGIEQVGYRLRVKTQDHLDRLARMSKVGSIDSGEKVSSHQALPCTAPFETEGFRISLIMGGARKVH